MIPRIIHYCWLSGDPYPADVQRCIDSWHHHMPDWEYMLWDLERVKSIDSPWLHECITTRKWAFAADFIRLYAVEHFGGIYLDCDCLALKSLTSFLSHQAFIGREWFVHIDCFTTFHYLTSHCFGAEPHHPFIKRCLEYYCDRHFILTQQTDLPDFLRYDQRLLPQIQCTIAAQHWGYEPRPSHAGIQQLTATGQPSEASGLTVYPYCYFDCYDQLSCSHVKHLALGGWSDYHALSVSKVSFTYRIKFHLHKWLLRFLWKRGFILTRKQ